MFFNIKEEERRRNYLFKQALLVDINIKILKTVKQFTKQVAYGKRGSGAFELNVPNLVLVINTNQYDVYNVDFPAPCHSPAPVRPVV